MSSSPVSTNDQFSGIGVAVAVGAWVGVGKGAGVWVAAGVGGASAAGVAEGAQAIASTSNTRARPAKEGKMGKPLVGQSLSP